MKIILTSNMAWNIAHFRRPIVEALLKDGHDVVALTPEDHGIPVLQDMGVTHVPIRIDSDGTSPSKDAALLWAYRRAFRDLAPDVVLGFTIKPNIYGGLAARSLRIPFVPNVSGLGTAFLKPGLLQKVATVLYRLSFRAQNCVIFQNWEDRDLFVRLGIAARENTVLVPGSGIDLDHFQYAPLATKGASEVTFLLVARMLRDKGVVEFVEAARQLQPRYPSVRFQLLGPLDVENRSAISAAEVDQWGASGVINYLGQTDDVRPFVAQADCVVLPSYREGAPRTLLEASAMGRPVVATDVPGCRQVVDDAVTGYLCQPRDADSLAAALGRIIDAGHDRRHQMGLAGRKKVETEFCQSIVVDTYRQILSRLERS